MTLPRPGQLYAVPLGLGRFGLVWVVSPGNGPDELVASAAAWSGSALPTDLLALEPVQPLKLTHPGASGAVAATRVEGPPPVAWKALGSLQGGPGVEAVGREGWAWLESQLVRQSLWELSGGPSRPPPAARASWSPLPGWKGVPRAYAQGARKALRQASASLRKLGRKAPEAERLAALRACVEALNALQAKRPFIGDPERADLLEALGQLAEVAGLPPATADRGRTW